MPPPLLAPLLALLGLLPFAMAGEISHLGSTELLSLAKVSSACPRGSPPATTHVLGMAVRNVLGVCVMPFSHQAEPERAFQIWSKQHKRSYDLGSPVSEVPPLLAF